MIDSLLMKKIVAKALVVDQSNRLLLLYRGMTHPHFPGHLDLPGGEVEDGEQWEEAVAREIEEETGLNVSEKNLTKVMEKSYHDVTHVLYVAQLAAQSPKPNLSWEHSNYKWFTKENLLAEAIPDGVDLYYSDVIEHIRSKM